MMRPFRRVSAPPIHKVTLVLLTLSLAFSVTLFAQSTGSLHGAVLDPTGAVIPGVTVTLTDGSHTLNTQSGPDGVYSFQAVPPGSYALGVQAKGFAPYSSTGVTIASAQSRQLNISLAIAVEQQNVTVSDQSNTVSVNPDENASGIILKGSDLDALSDDPTELANELQALVGTSAGPDGGQIYIDGFTGGQIPPKSSIREIRINVNPFSAEFDKLGYGRIEIITKAGSNKLSGQIMGNGTDSALNTSNPLVHEQPSYYVYTIQGNISGPIGKNASYFLNAGRRDIQNQSIIDALNPLDTTANLREVLPNPSLSWSVSPRIDIELGKNNTLTLRDSFNTSAVRGGGVGTLSLPQQAVNSSNEENDLQAGDTTVINTHLINELNFQWQRIRTGQVASYLAPAITVQGAFTEGGSNTGVVSDHQDTFELRDYSTATFGTHTLRFGSRWRAYRDANYSTSGTNGHYIFQTIAHYLAQTPDQYSATVINNPLARVLLVDGAFFYQDDWRWKPNFTLSYGLRLEGQNWIHDHADWAPRFSMAWAPGHSGKTPPKTVLRAGYGFFYNRFIFPCCGTSLPAVILAIHGNGVNQQNYVVNNPSFYDPSAPIPPSELGGNDASIPIIYSIDPHLRAIQYMQGAVGVDRQIGKQITFNVTYLQHRSIHTFNANNTTAPVFDPKTYTVIGPQPTVYNYQFQSGATWKQKQIIATTSAHFSKLSLNASYTFTDAKSDTQGFSSFPSDEQDPSLDFGRAVWGNHNHFFLLASYAAPYKITVAPLLTVVSGAPYNITIGSDLTGNNQFNARPTYGTCGAADVVSTPYGCLDTDPVGKDEKIIPYGLGTGPASVVFSLRVSKTIGVGPRIKGQNGGISFQGNQSVQGSGLTGGQALPKLDATVPRKYSLTLIAAALNLFNDVNLGPPNGVLTSPLFGKSQSTISYSGLPGNRVITLNALFSF